MRTSSAATSAALATKLLMLLRSNFAASSTCLRSSSVKYTKVFLPRRGFERRRDAAESFFAIAEMVSLTNVGLKAESPKEVADLILAGGWVREASKVGSNRPL
jgi:hypothetical protein